MKTTLRLSIAAFGLVIFNLSTATVQSQDYIYTTNNGKITMSAGGQTQPAVGESNPAILR